MKKIAELKDINIKEFMNLVSRSLTVDSELAFEISPDYIKSISSKSQNNSGGDDIVLVCQMSDIENVDNGLWTTGVFDPIFCGITYGKDFYSQLKSVSVYKESVDIVIFEAKSGNYDIRINTQTQGDKRMMAGNENMYDFDAFDTDVIDSLFGYKDKTITSQFSLSSKDIKRIIKEIGDYNKKNITKSFVTIYTDEENKLWCKDDTAFNVPLESTSDTSIADGDVKITKSIFEGVNVDDYTAYVVDSNSIVKCVMVSGTTNTSLSFMLAEDISGVGGDINNIPKNMNFDDIEDFDNF